MRLTRGCADRERRGPARVLTRSGHRTVLRLVAIAGVLALACQATPAPPGPPPSETAATATATASPGASRVPTGGTLRVGLPDEIGLLDPGGDDPAAEPILRQLYEGLVERDGDRVVGRLATKWSVAADGRSWTFALRDGVRFHDGTPLDAAAAAASLLRPIGGRADPIIASATAAGPLALTVTTRAPFAPFLRLLGTSRYAIVRVGRPNIGTGPFQLPDGGATARPLVLERNPVYWRPGEGGSRLPYLDRIVFRSYPEESARIAALRSGAVDLATELPIPDVPTVRADPSLQLVTRPATSVLTLALNLEQSPLVDLRVRQAIAAAVNRRALVDRLFAGEARPATQLLPPATLGHDDSVLEFSRNDPEIAKKLLAQAGKSTFEIDLWYVLGAPASRADARRVAESVAADLAAVGITAVLKTIDPVTFMLGVRENRYPLWIESSSLGSGDPDEVLGRLFIPPVVDGVDQPTAGGGWLDREAAGLLRKARIEPDESKRSELYKQVTKIVQQQIPRVPLVWSAAPAAATRKVVDPLAFWSGAAAIGR